MRRLVMEKVKLTSVKVQIKEQYKFKKTCLENDMNFQKLVNRALYLYNSVKKFKDQIEKTIISGLANIYNSQELDLGLKLKNLDLLGFIDNMKKTNQDNINILKASDSKIYYKKLNKKRKKKENKNIV